MRGVDEVAFMAVVLGQCHGERDFAWLPSSMSLRARLRTLKA